MCILKNMARSYALGNGQSLVIFDDRGQVRDFYYPYVGINTHVGGERKHRIGVMANGVFRWFDDEDWNIRVGSQRDTMATRIKAYNPTLGVSLVIEDVLHSDSILLRHIHLTNALEVPLDVKLFVGQEFEINGSQWADTVYYDPVDRVVVHYKHRVAFLINAFVDNVQFNMYSMGAFGSKGKEGTFRDAEDGVLSGNTIEHGRVDSVIGIEVNLAPRGSKAVCYWIAVADSLDAVKKKNHVVITNTLPSLQKETCEYWHAWIKHCHPGHFANLSQAHEAVHNQSLLMIRSHTDMRGGILAAGDSFVLPEAHDTYACVWPRDGAFIALALLGIGDMASVKQYLRYCSLIITRDGYMMQKYHPDATLASTWHSSLRNGKMILPIQEDETALTLYLLGKYYSRTHDMHFVQSVYDALVCRPARFMMHYLDKETSLPLPSYDLWERKYSTHAFTSATVYAGLSVAADIASAMHKDEAHEYRQAAERVRRGLQAHFWNENDKFFYRNVDIVEGAVVPNAKVDISSFYGMYFFGVYDARDERCLRSRETIEHRLWSHTHIGGVGRFEGDAYFRVSNETPGNPWFIATMWYAQYLIDTAGSRTDLVRPKDLLDWAVTYALDSGVMSEQVNPTTGEQLSAGPLTWSHAEYIRTVRSYVSKWDTLE